MEREWAGLVGAGRLDGVLLSGGDQDGVQLLQRYVDRCGVMVIITSLYCTVLCVDRCLVIITSMYCTAM